MADDRPGITPADDPYEFDWPDDAKDARAAEREAESKTSDTKPAPILLTALVLGIGMVLVFIFPVALVAGAIGLWVALAAPVIVGGLVLGLLPAWLMLRASRTWRKGVPELGFIIAGFLIGFGWTWFAMTAFQEFLFENEAAMEIFRVRASAFMGTAVAAGYLAAYSWTDSVRRHPRFVYSAAAFIGLSGVLSVIANVFFGR